ncbi:MAG: biopolymer transporter ExbB [Deltaproteobacteria bacterium]|jgi:biopolymer transport protein ExbB|nr:biopolymer transporter ExbB [Deltaproteobacteria bacterium]MDP7318742.1 MotA/TolQ/ExbB proton channel family protein [SAR324 cluster bacterium]
MIELVPLWEGPWWSDLLGLFGLGGVMMLPLGICSVLTLTVIFDRLWFLRSGRLLPGKALRVVREQAEENPGRPSKLAPENKHPVGRILRHGLDLLPTTSGHLQEALRDQAHRERHTLERGLTTLEVIAGIAPLLGLLGTALGMIEVFQNLALAGPGRNEALSRGISEALLTTVLGLGIGIPALVAHSLFARKIEALSLRIEEEVQFVYDCLQRNRAKPTTKRDG